MQNSSKIKKNIDVTKEFIDMLQKERSLWDIKFQIREDRNAKLRRYGTFKENLNMESKYVLYTWVKEARKGFLSLKLYDLFWNNPRDVFFEYI